MKKYIVMQKVGYKVVEYTFNNAADAVFFLEMLLKGKAQDDYGEDAIRSNLRVEEVENGKEADV